MSLIRGSFHLRSLAKLKLPASSSVATNMRAVSSANSHYPHGITSLSEATSMAACIKRLGARETFIEQPLVSQSKFVRPLTLTYELDGKKRRWDATETHDSIAVVIYHRERDAFLVVRQFRPAVYAASCRGSANKPDYTEGFTFELCAGILDKPGLTLEEIVSEEIQEECGYTVPAGQIKAISSSIANSGTGGAISYMFYCSVDESMKKGITGGLADHGEVIELVSIPRGSVMPFVLDPDLKRSPGLQFGLLWALTQHKD